MKTGHRGAGSFLKVTIISSIPFFWNSYVRYLLHKILASDRAWTQFNTVRSFTYNFVNINLILLSNLCLGLPNCLLPLCF